MPRLIKDQQEIGKWLASQLGPIDIAVAFWGRGAVDLLNLHGKEVRILLDLSAGGTNPFELRRLLKAFGREQVRQLPRLHAKTFLGQSSAIIGSANASAAALGVEGNEARRWTELGIEVEDRVVLEDAHTWFKQKWSASHEIKPVDVQKATLLWRRMRQRRGWGEEDHLLSQNLPVSAMQERRIYVVVSVHDLSAKATAMVKQRSKELGVQAHAWEDWPKIPPDAYLISFEDDEDGLRRDEPLIYRTLPSYKRSKLKWVDAMAEGSIEGMPVGPWRDWKARLRMYKAKHPKLWERDGICVPLREFIEETATPVRS